MIAKRAPLFPAKTLFQSSFLITHFSTSPPPSHRRRPFFPRRQRKQQEDSRSVKVSVWWDFENCHLPVGVNVFSAAQNITAAVRANGVRGPVQITAYGNVSQLSKASQRSLSFTGIDMVHVPNGGKNSADRALFEGLMEWVSQNPPPAHVFLISGDADFASCLHKLRRKNYSILLGAKGPVPDVLCSAANIMWYWNEIVKGENLIGEYVNQPPDGPYGSWYGSYKLPLKDLFAVPEPSPPPPPPSSPPIPLFPEVKEPVDSIRRIPEAVIAQARQILRSHPRGIPMAKLGANLWRRNVMIDEKYSGYEFSRFLLALPGVLKLQDIGNGLVLVRGFLDGPHCPSTSSSWRKVDMKDLEFYSKKNWLWKFMQKFVRKPKGSLATTESGTKEQMASNLQKDGPWVLQSFVLGAAKDAREQNPFSEKLSNGSMPPSSPSRWPKEDVQALKTLRARWPKEDMEALKTLRAKLETQFQEAGRRPEGPAFWEQVSLEMKKSGFDQSAKRCRDKWKNDKARSPEDSRRHVGTLDALYSSGGKMEEKD